MKLDRAVEQYIRLKQSLGCRFSGQGYALRGFSRAMGKVTVGQVKPERARAYLDNAYRRVPSTWISRWTTLRGFYTYAIARGMAQHSPLPLRAPKVAETFIPYIYTEQDLRMLLEAITPERTKNLSPQTMRTFLLLLYGAGLRLSEALNLQDSQVDLKECVLHVQRSKFFKSRLVPIGPKLAKVLADYVQDRPSIKGSHQCFFRANNGCRLARSTMGFIFRAVRKASGVRRTDGASYQPRMHDLRHTRATHCLLACYREGGDVQTFLPQLSAYLGHLDIVKTQRYLSIIPELREQASERFARYVWGGGRE